MRKILFNRLRNRIFMQHLGLLAIHLTRFHNLHTAVVQLLHHADRVIQCQRRYLAAVLRAQLGNTQPQCHFTVNSWVKTMRSAQRLTRHFLGIREEVSRKLRHMGFQRRERRVQRQCFRYVGRAVFQF